MAQIIVIGGGLAGLSAAHQCLQNGSKVTLIERNAFCGGNSIKATSGISGTLTAAQISKGSQDNAQAFIQDTTRSSQLGDPQAQPTEIIKTLCNESGPAIEWLIKSFGLDLSLISRLGGHSHERTHRGTQKFPGMTITYALMEKFEQIQKETSQQWAKLLTKCKVTKLIKQNEEIIGVEYENKNGQIKQEYGSVIVATGGYGADFSEKGILAKERPDLLPFSTTNGEHCDGSGIKISQDIGANTVDMGYVQVHPTGLVDTSDPYTKTKFLAAEALRGQGGILLDANGNRFCDELGRRDYVSNMMAQNKGPFRLVLNSAASKEIEWHIEHYKGRNLMVKYDNGTELAQAIGCSTQHLNETFQQYKKYGEQKKDPFGKKFFNNYNFQIEDYFHVSVVTPVVHYCMGGLEIDHNARVIGTDKKPIKNLYATGEVCGGVHGKNRLGGNSLLDCVVFGRVSARSATADLLKNMIQVFQGENTDMEIDIEQEKPIDSTKEKKYYTQEEVKKHNKINDSWTILYDKVYDITSFISEHPGGKGSIKLFAGKDCTKQYSIIHQKDLIEKFGSEYYIGELKKEDLNMKQQQVKQNQQQSEEEEKNNDQKNEEQAEQKIQNRRKQKKLSYQKKMQMIQQIMNGVNKEEEQNV